MGIFRISRKLKFEPLECVKPLLDESPVDVDAAMAVFAPVLNQIDFDSKIKYNLESILEENSFEELSLFWKSVKRTRSFCSLLASGIFLLASGMGLLIIGVNLKQADEATTTWSVTCGTVIESEVSTSRGSGEGGDYTRVGGSTGSRGGGSMGIDGRTSGGPGPVLYSPEIRYTYVVDDQRYYSDRVFADDRYANDDLDQHEAIIVRYPEGEDTEVFYNPQNPGQSVLITGDSPGTELTYTSGIIILIIGGLCTLLYAGYTLRKI